MTDNLFSDAPALPDWLAEQLPFRRRIYHGGDYRMHFIDEGTGPVVLMQHGNPAWCYLWRNVIRLLLEARPVRVIAPDLIGMGLSDKPRNPGVHTLEFHGNQLSQLIRALDLRDITLVGQDWGGPVTGLAASMNNDRIAGAVYSNTYMRKQKKRPKVSPFYRFVNTPLLAEGVFHLIFPLRLMTWTQGDPKSIGPKEKRAYRYPMRAMRDRGAPLAMARQVPTNMRHPTVDQLAIVDRWARCFSGPVELVWGCRDPMMGGAWRGNLEVFPGAWVTKTDGGHYLAEEHPREIAEAILRVIAAEEAGPAPEEKPAEDGENGGGSSD